MPAKKKTGTAGAKKKPKRQALPGGAPMPSKRSSSSSSKKKRTSSKPSAKPKPRAAATRKAKPPCKYGPRDADGYCPKKPSTFKSTRANPTRVTAKTTDAAVEQGIKVLTNPKASTEQKSAAVQQVGTTILTDAARKSVRKNAPKIKETLKEIAPAAGIVAGSAVVLKVGGKALTANRQREAKKFADAELAKTKKRMGSQITPQIAATLWQQYYDFKLKQPVTTSYLGK